MQLLIDHLAIPAMHSVLVLASALLPFVAGHFQMTIPPTRLYYPGAPHGTGLHGPGFIGNVTCEPEVGPKLGTYGCLWFSQGCQPGCSKCTDKTSGDTCSEPGGTMKPTLNDPKLRTYSNIVGYDATKNNPWRSPGHSPIFSPCGLAGGGNNSHEGNGAKAPPGVKQGLDGAKMKEGPKTQWPQGSVQDVAFSITANHGGGYTYRLCPKSSALTEECFQKHILEYAEADTSWIQFGSDTSNRTAITATRTSEGTYPKGSVWTKNPIPACEWGTGGVGSPNCALPMFKPPLPGLFGYGSAACFTGNAGAGGHCTDEQRQLTTTHFNFHVLDKVKVPTDLPVGEYLLSWRIDCEQTPQIWSQCSDITITAKEAVVV